MGPFGLIAASALATGFVPSETVLSLAAAVYPSRLRWAGLGPLGAAPPVSCTSASPWQSGQSRGSGAGQTKFPPGLCASRPVHPWPRDATFLCLGFLPHTMRIIRSQSLAVSAEFRCGKPWEKRLEHSKCSRTGIVPWRQPGQALLSPSSRSRKKFLQRPPRDSKRMFCPLYRVDFLTSFLIN